MQRYFAEKKEDNNFSLYESDIHHIKNVMRYHENDLIEVVYDKILYTCKITNISPLSLEIIDAKEKESNSKVTLTIALSLVNEQKMDLILQKLTELGVSRIIPIVTTRSIIKLDEKRIEKKLTRWKMICKEASEQSKRIDIPIIDDIKKIDDIINLNNDIKLLCTLKEKPISINNYLPNQIKDILFAIGPEGGFTDEEEQKLLNNGFKPVSLGKRVMRVETAAIYVASIINYIYEG